jgi:hypothetical protein
LAPGAKKIAGILDKSWECRGANAALLFERGGRALSADDHDEDPGVLLAERG